MAKRKAGVNDIIYELDNDDIVISSDEEGKESKIGRFEDDNKKITKGKKQNIEEVHSEVIILDSSGEPACAITSSKKTQIGGKCISKTSIQNSSNVQSNINSNEKNVVTDINDERIDGQDTIIFNEDIAVDSPASNTDLGVVGCENRAPLVSVRFKDNFLAHNYKKRIKEFIVTLLKTKTQNDISADSETDNELEIWPEDLAEEEFNKFGENTVEENLFFVDTIPCDDLHSDVPTYSQATNIISNIVEKVDTPQIFRRGPICFNCEGSHPLKDCSLPRDNAKINERRKAVTPRMGRYHVEDDQKYGHLVPGRISADLRHALGLKRYELPLHIYRMRLLGYPPGWLEEARISHSGITLFDSTGTPTLDPDEEEGEVCEPGSKDKFDIKKILDFPGFNVAASSRYIEEAELFGLPPMSDQDSKIAMLQILAPNAMKAYKRKKLSFFPSSSKNDSQEGQAEMELDSGDEVAEFPLVPPLPDDEPPPPLPPPPPPPPVEAESNTQSQSHMDKHIDSVSPEQKISDKKKALSRCSKEEFNGKPDNDSSIKKAAESNSNKKPEPVKETVNVNSDESSDDLEVIEVVRVNDIPMPEEDLIIIDDDDKSSLSSGRNSPTLDDLEERKQRLLDALKSDTVSVTDMPKDNNETDEKIDGNSEEETSKDNGNLSVTIEGSNEGIAIKEVLNEENATEEENYCDNVKSGETEKEESIIEAKKPPTTLSNEPQVDNKAGKVRDTLYGTPVINIASPYSKLPSDDKFSKDICDVINFENLPNSIGKFKQISNLLKKVKTEVDRIQDS